MTDSPAKYRAIPSSEDQAYDSNVHEARIGGDERVYPTSQHIPAEPRTKWTYFLLGCAIFLPWHGDISCQTAVLCELTYTQSWLMRRRFSCPDWQVPPSTQRSAHTSPASTQWPD